MKYQLLKKRVACIVLTFLMLLPLFPQQAKAATTTLGSKPVGSIVKIKENGVYQNYVIIQMYYEGNSGTLLMREKGTAGNENGWSFNWLAGDPYFESHLDYWLMVYQRNKYEAGLLEKLQPISLYVDTQTAVRDVFTFSIYELGLSHPNYRSDGEAIAYFNASTRVRGSDYMSPAPYLTRSASKTDDMYSAKITKSGTVEENYKVTAGYFMFPLIVLPDDMLVADTGEILLNTPPTAPASITATLSGNSIHINWAASADADGNLAGYILERSADNGASWSVVTNINAISFQDAISEGWTSAVYRVKACDSGGLESPYTVSNVLPLPYITGIDAPFSIPHTGGNTAITVSGVNLVDGITVKVFDGTTAILSGSTTGNSTAQSVTLPFPANISYTADRTFTVKASLDDGSHWSSITKTVVVERNITPVITDVSVSPVHLSYNGGTVTITVTGFNLPNGLLVEAYTDEDAIRGNTIGNDMTQAANLELPANWSYADTTVYGVRASLNSGEIWFTSPSVVTIDARDIPAPVIEQDLDAELALVEGDTLELSIEASAESGTLSYQWHKDGAPIPEQNSDTLTIPDIALADAGDYFCTVTTEIQGRTASATSRVCSVSVQTQADVPVILENLPEERTVIEWQGLSLSVAASCENGSLSYEWFKDGKPLDGETQAALLIPEAGPEDAGTYFCRITSTYGLSEKSIDSAFCDVTVKENTPVFENDIPDERSVIEAHDLTLSVSATSPAGEIAYQWYKDGAPLTGETTPELRIPSVIPLDAGEYFCRATATYGAHQRSADSNTCAVSVQGNAPKIVRDLPSDMALIETQALTLSITADSADGELSYSWYKDGELIPEETEPAIQIPSVTKTHAGLYFCRVINTYGEMQWTADSTACFVSIQEGPATPVIEQDLDSSVTVASGSSLSLIATASSVNGILTCQWYKNDAALTNATDSSLFIENIVPDDAGRYYCIFTNTIGAFTASARTQTCLVIYNDPDAGPSPTPEPEPAPEPSPSPDPTPLPSPEPTPVPEPPPTPEPPQRPSRTHDPRPKVTSSPTPEPSCTPKPKRKASTAPATSSSSDPSPSPSPVPASSGPTPKPELEQVTIVSPIPSAPATIETSLPDNEPPRQRVSVIPIGIGIAVLLGLAAASYFIWKKRRKG